MLAPTYVQMLKALSGWLIKAEAQMPNGKAEALLSARLAPDMLPLATQAHTQEHQRGERSARGS